MIVRLISGCLLSLLVVSAAAANTLDEVKERGVLHCGVHEAAHGFAILDDEGGWTGMDVDFCRAVAAAIFGDENEEKVEDRVLFTPLTSKARFGALMNREVDVVFRTTTATLSRDVENSVQFGPPTFYTGTAIMVRTETGAESIADLGGATVCVAPGSTTELNIAAAFAAAGVDFEPVVIESRKDQIAAYLEGRCDVMTTDHAALPGIRAFDAPNPDEHVILPDILSKEPLAPVTRDDDPAWTDLVAWVVHATFNAEEFGVTSQNVDEMDSKDPRVAELLGKGDLGPKLGLDAFWARNVIALVGNYGEIYDAHFGPDSALELERGLNAQHVDGGLHYGWPLK